MKLNSRASRIIFKHFFPTLMLALFFIAPLFSHIQIVAPLEAEASHQSPPGLPGDSHPIPNTTGGGVTPTGSGGVVTPKDGGGGGVTPGGCPAGQLCNPIAADSIAQLVATILDIIVKIGAPIIIFFLIYVGFLFTTARGNTETLGTAKKALVWTLVGGLIILGASAIAEVVCSTITEISGSSACS